MDQKNKYSHITSEMWADMLEQLVHEMTAEQIMAIPGVYDAISEELNNEALGRIMGEEEED